LRFFLQLCSRDFNHRHRYNNSQHNTASPWIAADDLLTGSRQRVRHLDLGLGDARFTAYGCDLSYDYIRINADESMQIEVSPQGRLGRKLSLHSYSPTLKHQLLVDGLGYARRFVGLRVMIHLSGSVLKKATLLSSLVQDLELILDTGLRPVLVLPTAQSIAQLHDLFAKGPYSLTTLLTDAAQIGAKLDRGQACLFLQPRPDPGFLVALAIRLGVGKLLTLADDQGLHDSQDLRSKLTPEQGLSGLDRGRFETNHAENLAWTRHAAIQGLPALHLIDGRIAHALVAELFTNQGIGTLLTRLY